MVPTEIVGRPSGEGSMKQRSGAARWPLVGGLDTRTVATIGRASGRRSVRATPQDTMTPTTSTALPLPFVEGGEGRPRVTASDVAQVLRGVDMHFGHEAELQQALDEVFHDQGWDAEREFALDGSRDSIVDFFLDGLAIEVKVDGTSIAVLRQLQRYAACEEVRELLLVTTKHRHRDAVPETLLGKPVHVFLIQRF